MFRYQADLQGGILARITHMLPSSANDNQMNPWSRGRRGLNFKICNFLSARVLGVKFTMEVVWRISTVWALQRNFRNVWSAWEIIMNTSDVFRTLTSQIFFFSKQTVQESNDDNTGCVGRPLRFIFLSAQQSLYVSPTTNAHPSQVFNEPQSLQNSYPLAY